MARQLLLIKHASAKIDQRIPRTEWSLTDLGRQRCSGLADALADYLPITLFSSAEPKALETATLVGDRLGIVPIVIAGLQENDRTGMIVTPSPVFRRRISTFFKNPDERVLGHESAQEALIRFSSAIAGMTATYLDGNLAVVTHGAVLSLFVAAHNHFEPFPFWQHLGDPSFVVLSLPNYQLMHTVEHIANIDGS